MTLECEGRSVLAEYVIGRFCTGSVPSLPRPRFNIVVVSLQTLMMFACPRVLTLLLEPADFNLVPGECGLIGANPNEIL